MGHYVLDFYCCAARVNIELDGNQHGLPDQLRHDRVRDNWLVDQGVYVLRFANFLLRSERQSVQDTI